MFVFFAQHHTVAPKIAAFDFGAEPLNFGEPASVQCTILGGDLPMRVTWLLNNRSVDLFGDISLSKIGKRIHVLSIESVAGHHAGNYSCRAKNMAGMTEHSAVLTVNGLFFSRLFFKYNFTNASVFLSFFVVLLSFCFSKLKTSQKIPFFQSSNGFLFEILSKLLTIVVRYKEILLAAGIDESPNN